MNRTITILTLLLFAGMVLPSCGITIVKRQHTGGYYVSTNSSKDVGKGDVAIRTDENKPIASTQSAAEKIEERAVAETRVTINEQPNAFDVPAIDKQNNTTPVESVEAPSTHRTFSWSSMTEKVPMLKKMDSTVKKVKSNSNRSMGNDGLSLIWIVILVLLVLWILGLLGGGWGLGGLINLLLVVALILLILWLLRII
jgi:hypothetical protein